MVGGLKQKKLKNSPQLFLWATDPFEKSLKYGCRNIIIFVKQDEYFVNFIDFRFDF